MKRFKHSLMVIMAATMLAPALWMLACAGGGPPGTGGAGGTKTTTDTSPACSTANEVPCMRYTFTLDGNPSSDVATRNKYIAAFGDACYMTDSDPSSFVCYYQKPEAACADAVNMAEVYGAAPFDKGYPCLKDDAGTGNYSLQVGPDVANNLPIYYQNAPRQTPLTDVDGVPMEVNGPYRNLTDPAQIGPGTDFYGNSGVSNGDGGYLRQRDLVLRVNRNGHDDGKIHSDLAGFKWTCPGSDGGPTTCEEPDILEDPDKKPLLNPEAEAQVHHVVPMKDLRCCPWGTNSYKNAAVISRRLNVYLTNNNPPAEEVKQLNKANPYPP
jgi:hypothetical protein